MDNLNDFSFEAIAGDETPFDTLPVPEPEPRMPAQSGVWCEVLTQMKLPPEAQARMADRAAREAQSLAQLLPGDEAAMRAWRTKVGKYASDDYGAGARSALLDQSIQSPDDPNNLYTKLSRHLESLAAEIKGNRPPDDLSAKKGWFGRVTDPMRAYLAKWTSAQTRITRIADGIHRGKRQLEMDNEALKLEGTKLRGMDAKLREELAYGLCLLAAMEDMRDLPADRPEVQRFVDDEIILPLSKKAEMLQQILQVNRLAYAHMSITYKNNQLLIIKADSAIKVSLHALKETIVHAQALANQQRINRAVDVLDTTTDELLKHTSERMLAQGRDIQESLLRPGIRPETFQRLYDNAILAVEDAERFRERASVEIQRSVQKLAQAEAQAQARIERMKGLEAET